MISSRIANCFELTATLHIYALLEDSNQSSGEGTAKKLTNLNIQICLGLQHGKYIKVYKIMMKRLKLYLDLFHIQSISKTVFRNQRIFFLPPMATMIISGNTVPFMITTALNDISVSKPKMSHSLRIPSSTDAVYTWTATKSD